MIDKARFSLVPIQGVDVVRQVLKRVESLLDEGMLTPGQKLPSERDLAETLQVSRTSVRQVLKILEASGRVVSRKGSGTYAAARSSDDGQNTVLPAKVDRQFMKNLITTRAYIEQAIFREYCYASTKSGLKVLDELIARQRRSKADDDHSGLDLEFEACVATLLGNPMLKKIQTEIHQILICAWNDYGYKPEKFELLHQEHIYIFNALKERNYTMMTSLLDSHLNKDI